jgi:hypothetical protein
MLVTVYGVGGLNPALPNSNIIEEYEIPDEEPTAPTKADLLAQLAALTAQIEALPE